MNTNGWLSSNRVGFPGQEDLPDDDNPIENPSKPVVEFSH
ncbi:hypothetical protein ABH945_004949 [Paraburkholderia sp. GAS333]